MPKKQHETYHDYKKRVIDEKSETFCAAKWLNATIWLGSGTTTSCHHPPAHRINKKEILTNPSAIHNTPHKKQMRKLMLQGERPEECEYCWKIEDIDRNNVSDRTYKTVIYSDEDIQNCNSYEEDVNLKTLEIAFDSNCNFACSYCNPSFSTKWQKDIKQHGHYENLVSDGAAAFQQDGSWSMPYKKNDDNPYIKAFWDWWPKLSKSLQELRITGGEPLMSPDVWKLFDYFKNNPSNMNFAINSNLGAKPELVDRLIQASHGVKSFTLYTSCEAVGPQAEYIRDGLNYEYFCKNIEKVLEQANLPGGLHIMMTINSLCLFSITDFFDQMLIWKEKYGARTVHWTVNILRFPSFMSPLALPDHILQERQIHLLNWLKENKSPLMDEMDYESIKRLIDYLETVDNPHKFTSGIKSRHRDFKTFYQQYDKRRNKSFRNTFPKILVDWFDEIPETKLNKIQKIMSENSPLNWKTNKNIKETAKEEGWDLDPQSSNPGSVDYVESKNK